jgi:hypothetical protein
MNSVQPTDFPPVIDPYGFHRPLTGLARLIVDTTVTIPN